VFIRKRTGKCHSERLEGAKNLIMTQVTLENEILRALAFEASVVALLLTPSQRRRPFGRMTE
jgi:hypothetical protein